MISDAIDAAAEAAPPALRGGTAVDFDVGVMIETPRAAVIAGDLAAAGAEFFSVGSNDLTQMSMVRAAAGRWGGARGVDHDVIMNNKI